MLRKHSTDRPVPPPDHYLPAYERIARFAQRRGIDFRA